MKSETMMTRRQAMKSAAAAAGFLVAAPYVNLGRFRLSRFSDGSRLQLGPFL